MSLATRSLARKASYFVVLFITAKDSPRDSSITILWSFSMIMFAPLPLELDDPSTKMVQIPSSFSLTGKVVSAMKLATACALGAFRDS